MHQPANPSTDQTSGARLAAILDAAFDAIIAETLDGIITDWNGAAERLFGYAADDIIGYPNTILAAPGREDELRAITERVRLGETVALAETQRRRSDGGILDLSVVATPIFDSNGQVTGVSKIARDIGGAKRASRERALLAAIVSSSDDAIVSKDLNGTITSWNQAAEALLGYSPEEVIGRHISVIAVPGKESDMAGILEKIRRGERVAHYETERRHKDGRIIQISLTVSPIYDQEGRIIGASKIARNIGERRKAEERLKLLMGELDHRAKNVLAVAQAMLRLTRSDTVPEFVNAVEGRIRALARVHSQVAENRWGGAELQKLVSGSLEAFGDGEGRIVSSGPPIWLTPAAAQVIGVLLHELATNAAKHGALSSTTGMVEIDWSIDPDRDLRLVWREKHGPEVSPPTRRSFGTQVIERNIPDQLGGAAKVRWHRSGLECEFVVPSSNMEAARPLWGAQVPAA